MDLLRFVESTLQRTGGLAEAPSADVVQALLPAAVAGALGVPEEARLRLHGGAGPGEVAAGYGSGLLPQVCALAEGGSRRHRVELAGGTPKRERIERESVAVLVFQNGVGRVESLEEAALQYFIFDFRFAALSEETHEGLATVALDPEGGSSGLLAAGLSGFLADRPDARRPWSGGDDLVVRPEWFEGARRLALARARAETRGLLARLDRRLWRDIRRIDEYYEALCEEVLRRRSRSAGNPEATREKLRSIEAERSSRRHGLLRRYTVTLRLEPIGMLALRVAGLRLRCRLQRRKRERRASLAWNPIARQFDRWLCECCGAEAGIPSLCDDLHVLCEKCLADADGTGSRRPSCGACRGGTCSCSGAADRAPAS